VIFVVVGVPVKVVKAAQWGPLLPLPRAQLAARLAMVEGTVVRTSLK